MIRITIAVPEAQIGNANQLGRCLGLSEADGQTYGAPTWQDSGGRAYSVASAVVGAAFLGAATSLLVEPEWGADMIAATAAQALVHIGNPDEPASCAADPEAIVAVVHDDAMAALTLLGLGPAEAEA